MSKYVERVIEDVKTKYANEPEFCQTVEEVLSSLGPVVDAHPEYEKVALLERMVIPERVIEFRVPWEDDNGNIHVPCTVQRSNWTVQGRFKIRTERKPFHHEILRFRADIQR